MSTSPRKVVVTAVTLIVLLPVAAARARTEQPSDLIRWDDQSQGDGPFRFSVLSARSSNCNWDSVPAIGRGSMSLTFDLEGGTYLAADREPPFRTTIHEAGMLEDAVKAQRRPTVAELIASSLVPYRRDVRLEEEQRKEDGDLQVERRALRAAGRGSRD